MSTKAIVLRVRDYLSLSTILRQMRQSGRLRDEHLHRLDREVSMAQLRPDNSLPVNVVTLNSTVRYRDQATGKAARVSVVFPADVGASPDRVSILSPLGAALIGEREGAQVRCDAPGGVRRLVVEKIIGGDGS